MVQGAVKETYRGQRNGLSYESARKQKMGTAGTIGIVGVALSGVTGSDSMRAIQSCICTTDTPDNPCPCDGPIVWIPESALVEERPAGRQDHRGYELTNFVVRREARLLVESYRPIIAGLYVTSNRTASQSNNTNHIRTLAQGTIGSRIPRGDIRLRMAATAASSAGPLGALVAAFMAGFVVGGKWEEQSGGALSDAGAEAIDGTVSAAVNAAAAAADAAEGIAEAVGDALAPINP